LDNSVNEIELVFFGFVGCESVCPSALLRIGEALEWISAENEGKAIGALFADINYFRTYETADRYISGFSRSNNAMAGIHLNESQVRAVSSAFRLRIVNNGSSVSDIQHTDHLFVLRRASQDWILDAILPTGTSSSGQIKDALLRAASIR
jgi:cytochrome oxidase Cu insertion factor (SCO1/SenC/PrrC family)